MRLLKKKNLIFFTDKDIGRIYQQDDRLVDAFYNISAFGPRGYAYLRGEGILEPHGNANIEFPWGTPAGTHRCEIEKYGILDLSGPIEYWIEPVFRPVHPQYTNNYRWRYKDGTVVAEVLIHPKTKKVYDFRTRTKVSGKWQPNAYRPIVDRDQYDLEIRKLGGDPGKRNISIMSLENPHERSVFKQTAAIDNLGKQPKEIIDKLYDLPFVSARGKTWVSYKGYEGYAPSTDEDYHIIPKKADHGFVEISQKSCMRCHVDTMKDASELQAPREWYGRVRGDDNIVSFHIFDPKPVVGQRVMLVPTIRQELIDKGLIKHVSNR